jgi:hypothetical protein
MKSKQWDSESSASTSAALLVMWCGARKGWHRGPGHVSDSLIDISGKMPGLATDMPNWLGQAQPARVYHRLFAGYASCLRKVGERRIFELAFSIQTLESLGDDWTFAKRLK